VANVTQAAKVGLFFAGAIVAAYAVTRTVGNPGGSAKGYMVHGSIRDATGLANHSRVTIAGIPVGTIESIKLEGGSARVDVRVRNDVPLFANATIGKKNASLLGESVIVLTSGTEDQTKLRDGDAIANVVESASTEQILNDVARIADRVKLVSEQLAASLGTQEGGDNMKRILTNVAEATEALNSTIRENRETVRDTLGSVNRITGASEPQISKILENVKVITEDLKVLMAENTKKDPAHPEGKGELRTTIERVNRASSNLESALGHIDSVAARVDRGEGTIGRLTKDEALINEVQGVAEGVNDYVDGLRRVQAVVGLRSDYNFLAGTIKSYVELRLQPREDKYYLIELINDPRGKTSFTQTDVDSTNPNDPPHYRTVTTSTTDAFRFSIQFARRLGPFTGRFGIKESTGGLGLDLHLLSDRFEVTNDFFGFGETIRPRYRVFAGYMFLSRLWLLGGVDHIFVADQRDYFLGLQLRFTDDDLKTILPFAGSVGPGK
jgi:phospholipid/cholesterol/gamma-HCH transport system substrate-binding protein